MTNYGWIGPDYRGLASTQSYASRPEIGGMRIIELPLFSDEGGDFCELVRFTPEGGLAGLPDYRPAQSSYSYLEPGTIKAWHLHRNQDDIWFVPPHDRLLVGLLDTREEVPSYGTSLRLTLGAGRARLLLIPRGVAHGVANLSSRPAGIMYFANAAFDPEDPDEHRLPWDTLGGDFWTLQAR